MPIRNETFRQYLNPGELEGNNEETYWKMRARNGDERFREAMRKAGYQEVTQDQSAAQ